MTLALGRRPRLLPTIPRRLAGVVGTFLALTFTTTGVLAGSGTAAADGADGIEAVPVTFTVKVENKAVPCDPLTLGGGTATIRGTLTGPKKALEQKTVAGSVFTHGDGYDETFNNYPDDTYNVVKDLAKRGHVSVTYDRLGYGDSDKPNGNGVCIGTDATVLHQIVGQLRTGSYQTTWTAKPAFGRVASFGHSAGGFVAEQEAGVFKDIDVLGAVSTGLESATPLTLQRAAEQQVRCLNPATAPNGYAGLEADDQQFAADHIFNVEPKIAAMLIKNRTKDACAGTRNLQNILANSALNAAQTVPVLVVAGTNDMFFPNVQAHAATFALAPKTVKQIPSTGHAIAFSRNAPLFRNAVADFLTANRF